MSQAGKRVALVTGAGNGIGRASALAFASRGDAVVVADFDQRAGHETVRQILAAGGEASFVEVDVRSAASIRAMIAATVERHGRLDWAHNNAGIEGRTSGIVSCEEPDWDEVIAVDLKSVWLCMKHEIPAMLANGGGAIVNTSSMAGLAGMGSTPAYVAAKHGVVGLSKMAALEYARQGIRVNAVCPAMIRTAMMERFCAENPGYEDKLSEMHPIGRVGEAREVADAVTWLCSPASSFVTGHAMPIDGGSFAR
ncbi:MAG: glucose 1-dehydrogenase [Gammaproteobacteria bacterium]